MVMDGQVNQGGVGNIPHSPGNYNRHDIAFGKYFKAVNSFGMKVLHKVFVEIYCTLETSNGSLTIKEYWHDKLGWSNAQYRNAFTTQEREMLEKIPIDADFVCDITLLFKLIIKILGNDVDLILQELRDLKNLRNMVCHDNLTIDEADLANHIDSLKDLCVKILEGLSSVVGKDVKEFEEQIKDGLNNILEAKIEVLDVEAYLGDVESFRQQKHSKFIIEGRKELSSVYSATKILNPCTWLSDQKFNEFTVDRIFTTLVIVGNGNHILMHDILNVKLMKTRFVPRVIIVSGVMGSGKTSLHRYIIHEWCCHSQTIVGLLAVDIVIGIELRTVSCGSLVQFLREQLLKSTCRLFNESDIIPLLQEMNVLFCIDGMDEANVHGRNLVREIITKFTDSRVIITTRPEFTLELMQLAEEHILLKIEGFDEQGKMHFVNRVFTVKYPEKQRRFSETTKFLNFMSTTCQTISNHLSLPLSLSLLVVVWCDESVDVKSISTLTQLYLKIYDMCQRKLVSRLEAAGAGHAVSLSRKVSRWLLELGRVAWTMICKDEQLISELHSEDLMNQCDKENIDPIQTLSAFLDCEIKENALETKYIFSYPHLTSQEFLAAIYISHEVTQTNSFTDFSDDFDSPRFQQLMMYVTGLLQKSGNLNTTLASQIKTIFTLNLEVQPDDYHTWGKLLREAENAYSMSMVIGSVVNQTFSWNVVTTEPKGETEAKLNLLKETGAAPSELRMQVPYTTTLNKCEESREILNLIGKSERTKVRLHLEKEYNSPGYNDTIDTYALPLLKNNCLVEYKGHAGSELMSALGSATNVEALFIRISSLEALHNLRASIKMHANWKTKVLPTVGWSLKFMELFLDISAEVMPEDIPRLRFRRELVVKIANISDGEAAWAGRVVKNLNKHYNSVIFQSSSLTSCGMKDFLCHVSNNHIKLIRVLSDHPANTEEIQFLVKKYNVRIGWGQS